VDQNKMFVPCYNLNTGLPVAAATGLENRMCVKAMHEKYHQLIGKQVEGIQIEVDAWASTSQDPDAERVKRELHYIRFERTSEKQYSNGTRDKGRGQTTLAGFKADPKAVAANLNEAELVAVRLYTTLAYIS
jgi:hypothetical protein